MKIHPPTTRSFQHRIKTFKVYLDLIGQQIAFFFTVMSKSTDSAKRQSIEGILDDPR